MQRGQFLTTAGALVVYFSFAPNANAQASKPAAEANPLGAAVNTNVDSWLAIERNGDVVISWGKVELGTGIETAIRQLAADELYVPFDRTRVATIDTTGTPNQGYTAGSQSLTAGAIPVRQAATVARQMLIGLAAQHFSLAPETLDTADGYVFVSAKHEQRIAYGDLIGGRRFNAQIPKETTLRPQIGDRISGTSVPRVDIPPKLNGTYTYIQDVRLPGMLHARVIYPPNPSATLQTYDESPLHDIPEKIRVVRVNNFLAVVASSEWHAIRAQRELKVTWTAGTPLPSMSDLAHVVLTTNGTERTLVNTADVDDALHSAKQTISAQYAWPFQTHGSIGPSCAVADVREDKATIWSPTQGVFPLRGAIAQLLSLPAKSVRIVYVEGSGCYGENGADDVSGAAALISQEVGKPVRVQYMRADETAHDPKGPAMVMQLQGGLGDDGKVAAWDYHVWTPTHNARPDGQAGNLLPGTLTAAPVATISFVGGDRDAPNNYDIPSQRVLITDQRTAVLRQSALRGLGGVANTFANETFMDELAHAARENPIDFRMKHLKDPRERAVLDAVRDDYRPGRGVAWVRYENTEAIVAAVADVTIDRKTGAVRVNHVWIAHDCGFIVNPNGLRNQIEGNVIQGTSRALLEQVRFDPKGVTSVDWISYPILRFKDVPEVTIHLIDRRDEKVLGAGEAATTVIAPAIGNAIFAQTGVRLRTIPFTPEVVKAAL